MNFKTYLVGGALRDEIMGLPCKDHDYVVLAPSFQALKDSLLEQGCKIFVEKPEYLTIRCKHPTLGCVDFACARRDGHYSDGRRPDDVAITTALEEDLARRDFSCNAIARDVVTGELFDPYLGNVDIADNLLRAVGNATQRLDEDKLRAFRVVRFACTKHFRIDKDLWNAINRLTPNQFDGVSTERIREELLKAVRANQKKMFATLWQDFPVLWDVVTNRGIWFRPTTEDKE